MPSSPSSSPVVDRDGHPLVVGETYEILQPRREGFAFELVSMDPPDISNWDHLLAMPGGRPMAEDLAEAAKRIGAVSLHRPGDMVQAYAPPADLRRCKRTRAWRVARAK